MPAASTKEPDERERVFEVDSGASMHLISKKDLNSAELETMRTSRSSTTVMTANGEVQTREEATARRRWQSAVSKGFFNGTDVVSIVALTGSPIEIPRNQVHMFAKHHGSNRKDEFFPNTTLFGVDIADM